MIVWIIVAATALLVLAFGLMPDLPPTPELLLGFQSTIVDLLLMLSGIIKYIFGTVLSKAMMTILLAIFTFEPIYHFVIWLLKKIPMVGIK